MSIGVSSGSVSAGADIPAAPDKDFQAILLGGDAFSARAQELENRKRELDAATARYQASKAEAETALTELRLATSAKDALAEAERKRSAMVTEYELAERVRKRMEADEARTIKVAAEQAAAELKSAQSDRAKAADILSSAQAKEQQARTRVDTADQRIAEAERTRAALRGKADKLPKMLAAFIADLDGALA